MISIYVWEVMSIRILWKSLGFCFSLARSFRCVFFLSFTSILMLIWKWLADLYRYSGSQPIWLYGKKEIYEISSIKRKYCNINL